MHGNGLRVHDFFTRQTILYSCPEIDHQIDQEYNVDDSVKNKVKVTIQKWGIEGDVDRKEYTVPHGKANDQDVPTGAELALKSDWLKAKEVLKPESLV